MKKSVTLEESLKRVFNRIELFLGVNGISREMKSTLSSRW